MARSKQLTPRKLNQENPFESGKFQDLRAADDSGEEKDSAQVDGAGGMAKPLIQRPRRRSSISEAIVTHPSVVELIVCVAGIYISFLTWALLQERITTTPYGPEKSRFKFHLVLLAVQSLAAVGIGYLYVLYNSRSHPTLKRQPIFPNAQITKYYFYLALSSSLAAPFGYAALAHIDYVTFLLAKSCKLLPVMFIHITLYRRKFPLYKYLVVALVTAGVAVFTLQTSSGKKHKGGDSSSLYGIALLSINLLLDGVTNSTQDHLFANSGGLVSGPQMQCGLNAMGSVLTIGWLLVNPYSTELSDAYAFVKMHPGVAGDVAGFALCGAIGQVFIFYTLSRFGSLTLVTVTVTRKMFSMILSVVAFGHHLSLSQWAGVGLVFGGIGAEAQMKRSQGKAKALAKKAK